MPRRCSASEHERWKMVLVLLYPLPFLTEISPKKRKKEKKNGLVSLSTVEAAPKTIVRTLFDNKIAERRDRLWRIKKRTDIYSREDKN